VDQDEFLEIDQWMNNINSPVIAMYRWTVTIAIYKTSMFW
jgi:hypothetical protein